MIKTIGSACLLCSFLLLTSCTGPGIPTGTVSGKVTYNGQAVSEGIVLFNPAGEQGIPVQAEIQSDGSYRIYTPDGGIPVGDYRVAVTPPMVMSPDTADSPGGEIRKEVDNIPAAYHSPETSGLKITVVAGSQAFDIAMTE